MSEDNKFLDIVVVVVFVISIGLAMYSDYKEEETYGKRVYEFRIIDKYETIGSSFHLIGGRATETEYHIIFQTRCINRPDDDILSQWQEWDDEVSYRQYRKYEKGKTYQSEYCVLP